MNRTKIWSDAQRAAFRKGQEIARLGKPVTDGKPFETLDERRAFLAGFDQASAEMSSAALQNAWNAGRHDFILCDTEHDGSKVRATEGSFW